MHKEDVWRSAFAVRRSPFGVHRSPFTVHPFTRSPVHPFGGADYPSALSPMACGPHK